MSKKDTLTQCKLVQNIGDIRHELIGWCDTKKAIKSNVVSIEGREGLWVVEEVWTTQNKEIVNKIFDSYKKHRKHSDV